MSCIVLSSGYRIECSVAGGAKTIWLTNFVADNVYVKDTGDTTGTYSVVADDSGGEILVTADNGSGGHGLQAGLVIELSAGAYDGNYVVNTVPTATTFTVTAVFTATDTGSFAYKDQGNKIIGTSVANGTDLVFFKFEQELESAEVVENGTGSRENGTFLSEQNVGMTLFASKTQSAEDARRTLIDQVTKGRFVAVVEDQNGVKRVYGTQNGLKLSEGSNNSGKALADLSGFTFVLQGVEPELSFVYDDTGDDSGTPAEAFTAFTLPA